jgi:hypothetical protein
MPCKMGFRWYVSRVETKFVVFVFSQKFVFAFHEKILQKVMKTAKVFTKTFAKNDAGSENAVKHPNSKRQIKFRR